MSLIIDVSTGTVLTAETCVFINDDALTESEWDALDGMSDSGVEVTVQFHHVARTPIRSYESLVHYTYS